MHEHDIRDVLDSQRHSTRSVGNADQYSRVAQLSRRFERSSFPGKELAWIAYILTGDPVQGDPPLNFLLVGGAEVGDEDIEYGPARIFDPTFVANIDNALTKFSETDLDVRFDPAAMSVAQIYPNIWDEPRDSLRGEYAGYLETLKAYVHRTAELGQALLITLR
jgi:hypothetical protein